MKREKGELPNILMFATAAEFVARWSHHYPCAILNSGWSETSGAGVMAKEGEVAAANEIKLFGKW